MLAVQETKKEMIIFHGDSPPPAIGYRVDNIMIITQNEMN